MNCTSFDELVRNSIVFNQKLVCSNNMNTQLETTYRTYRKKLKQRADVEYAVGVLSWDKEVNMPPKGAAHRTQQIATLSTLAHELFMDSELKEVLKELKANEQALPADAQRNLTLTLHEHSRIQSLDAAFVRRRSVVCSQAYDAWLKARAANDFSLFQAALKEVVDIKKEEAERLGYVEHPYNALLEEFEPGYTAAMLDTLFEDVKVKLIDLVQEIRKRPQVENHFLHQHFPKDKQWATSIELLKRIGYDFEAGRQDWSPHPFTVNFSSKDVRVTTRVDENDLNNLIWSSLHEGGHALYEQGLPEQYYGLPMSRHISLGIHESQSRLWENNVGRSLAFWQAHFPYLQQQFPKQLSGISVEQFYAAMNKIQTGFIRTEADELHYHFHVLIRYELEKALLEDDLQVKDLNTAWNDLYKKYLDVDVPDDNRGVLQDVHWSYGHIGYFPTYSLGSFYAAQFFQQAEKELPKLREQIAQGDTSTLLHWLQKNIYQQGRRYEANELCEKLTGKPLNFDYFYQYATDKYHEIYT